MNCIARTVTIGCFLWMLMFPLIGGSSLGMDLFRLIACYSVQDHKGGVPLIMLAIPILFSGTVCALFLAFRSSSSRRTECSRSNEQRQPLLSSSSSISTSSSNSSASSSSSFEFPIWCHRYYQRITAGNGDINFDMIAILLLSFPFFIYLISSINRHLFREGEHNLISDWKRVGNAFGMVAVVAFSYLLIPVAKHGPILRVFGWSSARVLRLHVWCGRIVTIGSLVHGLMHMIRWKYLMGEDSQMILIPPHACWWTRNSEDIDFECNHEKTKCSCFDFFQNFMGLVAAIGILVLAVTSLNFVRRQCYKLFYMSHILAAPIILIALTLHYSRAILYIAPSLLYYVASSFPAWMESWSMRRMGSVKILSTERIEAISSGRPCTSITFDASDLAMKTYRSGLYVKLYAPEVSSLSHPFTICKVPGKNNQLRIIFREVGAFTRDLARRLTQGSTNLPTIHIDGYHGSRERVNEVLRHDVAILIAGGIGITPFLSLLEEVVSVVAEDEASATPVNYPTKKVILHWMCRDRALVDYVCREYFEKLIQSSVYCRLQIQIVVHETGVRQATRLPKRSSAVTLMFADDDDRLGYDSDSDSDTITGTTSVNTAFTPSRFSVEDSSSSCWRKFHTFLIFPLIAWSGLIASWYLYRSFQDDVWRRSYAVFAILVVGLLVSLTTISCCFKQQLRRESDDLQKKLPNLEMGRMKTWLSRILSKEDLLKECETCDELLPLHRKNTSETTDYESCESSDSNSTDEEDPEDIENPDERRNISLTKLEGRPSTDELMKDADLAHLPGIFCCGPVALLEDIHRIAEDKRVARLQDCTNQGSARFSVYDEVFLM